MLRINKKIFTIGWSCMKTKFKTSNLSTKIKKIYIFALLQYATLNFFLFRHRIIVKCHLLYVFTYYFWKSPESLPFIVAFSNIAKNNLRIRYFNRLKKISRAGSLNHSATIATFCKIYRVCIISSQKYYWYYKKKDLVGLVVWRVTLYFHTGFDWLI